MAQPSGRTFDVIVGGIRRIRRLGRQASGGGRRPGGARRLRPDSWRRVVLGAHLVLLIEVSRPRAGDHQAHATGAEGLLRMHGIQLRLVRRRSRRAVHDAGRQAVFLAGTPARHRRTHERLGPSELPPERPGLQGQVPRWVWRRLADRLQRPFALLRHRRGLRRHFGTGRRCGRTAGWPVPARDDDVVRGDAAAHPGESEARTHRHHRPHRESHQANQRPAGVSLLRTM